LLDPTPQFAFPSGNSPLPVKIAGAISLACKKYPGPLNIWILFRKSLSTSKSLSHNPMKGDGNDEICQA
jgi:hypothetical protein